MFADSINKNDPELFHLYDFRGEKRTYRKKLTLIDESIVRYLWVCYTEINHWGGTSAINPQPGKRDKEIYYAYRVCGQMRYYQQQHPLEWFDNSGKKDVEYLGIKFGIPSIEKAKKPTPKVNHITDNKYDRDCCYCGERLSWQTYTREHLVPSSKGGKGNKKNIRPCCNTCNTEKGDMLLREYIIFLNSKLNQVSGADLTTLQTKIANANKLAKELEND